MLTLRNLDDTQKVAIGYKHLRERVFRLMSKGRLKRSTYTLAAPHHRLHMHQNASKMNECGEGLVFLLRVNSRI